jgi:hypothetical protein
LYLRNGSTLMRDFSRCDETARILPVRGTL